MRGAGNTGVVTAARTHLGCLDLRPFGTRDDDRFRAELNSATTRLRAVLPEYSRHWGLARKGLNIFLRDCLYTVHLRKRYQLDRAELFFEVPLRQHQRQVHSRFGRRWPASWRGVRALDYRTSKRYQDAAARIAVSRGIPPIHLDAICWGLRE